MFLRGFSWLLLGGMAEMHYKAWFAAAFQMFNLYLMGQMCVIFDKKRGNEDDMSQ